MKYILICSDEVEGSTDLVCDWLNHLDKSFIRISSQNLIKILNIFIFNNLIDIEFEVKGNKYLLSEIKSYWYRRSKLGFDSIYHIKDYYFDGDNISWALNKILPKEYNNVIEYFEKELDKKAKLNKDLDNKLNKLEVLNIASSLGIKIPSTIVTQNKNSLIKSKNTNLITKAIGDVMFKDENSYGMMTNKIKYTDINTDTFFYTLFQSQIEKKFELRIFYMNTQFYSSAIFSQTNDKTIVDFRNYDGEKPNRVVPFILPELLKNKLKLLMTKLDLKSGSIDMAYTNKGEFVFFEVNPVGQFEQVSFPCCYDLHKKIAKYL